MGNGDSDSDNEVSRIHRSLGRIEGKLDQVMMIQEQEKATAVELAVRVGVVENQVSSAKSWAAGVAATISAAFAAVKWMLTP